MEDVVVTMHADLERALKKPPEQRRWAMLLDVRKCIGCHACTVACVSENKLPPKCVYRPVYDREHGKYPNVSRAFTPRPCMQCDRPACVAACPKKGEGGATWKAKTGVGAGTVAIDYRRCVGCGRCVKACPYGARALDSGKLHSDGTPERQRYELVPAFEYERAPARDGEGSPVGKARKCHFCVHRLARGLLPQCITSCVGRAGYFGDESDPASLIAKVKKANRIQILNPGAGTSPRVYYVANEKLEVIHG
jgi:tetrathionate reductase subunit B